MANKGAYRPSHRAELDRIEARRIEAGISQSELAAKAGISDRTYRETLRTGLAFRRRVNALGMALRTLESEARKDEELFPFAAAPRQQLRPGAGAIPASSTRASGAGLPAGASASSGQPHGRRR